MTQALGTSALHYQELRYHPQTGQRHTTKKKKKEIQPSTEFQFGRVSFFESGFKRAVEGRAKICKF
jgi:hypothetical protein